MAKEKKKSKSKDKTDKKVKSKSKDTAKVSKSKTKAKTKRTRKVIEVTPIKEKFTKSGLHSYIETVSGVERRHVRKVLNALENIMMGSVHPKGRGDFMLPGMLKVVVKDVPAKKGGEKKRNPFTGEPMITKAKPATRKVKVRPMSKLKKAALKEPK